MLRLARVALALALLPGCSSTYEITGSVAPDGSVTSGEQKADRPLE